MLNMLQTGEESQSSIGGGASRQYAPVTFSDSSEDFRTNSSSFMDDSSSIGFLDPWRDRGSFVGVNFKKVGDQEAVELIFRDRLQNLLVPREDFKIETAAPITENDQKMVQVTFVNNQRAKLTETGYNELLRQAPEAAPSPAAFSAYPEITRPRRTPSNDSPAPALTEQSGTDEEAAISLVHSKPGTPPDNRSVTSIIAQADDEDGSSAHLSQSLNNSSILDRRTHTAKVVRTAGGGLGFIYPERAGPGWTEKFINSSGVSTPEDKAPALVKEGSVTGAPGTDIFKLDKLSVADLAKKAQQAQGEPSTSIAPQDAMARMDDPGELMRPALVDGRETLPTRASAENGARTPAVAHQWPQSTTAEPAAPVHGAPQITETTQMTPPADTASASAPTRSRTEKIAEGVAWTVWGLAAAGVLMLAGLGATGHLGDSV